MATAPVIPLGAKKRVPFDQSIAWMGVDWTGAAAVMQIRNDPGDTGTAVIDLGASTAGSQGLAVTFDADFPDPDGELPDGATLVQVIIDEATLEALSLGSPTDSAVSMHYDIHLTPVGGKKFVFAEGTFTIEPGVTL